jgi:hypothetical protein
MKEVESLEIEDVIQDGAGYEVSHE